MRSCAELLSLYRFSQTGHDSTLSEIWSILQISDPIRSPIWYNIDYFATADVKSIDSSLSARSVLNEIRTTKGFDCTVALSSMAWTVFNITRIIILWISTGNHDSKNSLMIPVGPFGSPRDMFLFQEIIIFAVTAEYKNYGVLLPILLWWSSPPVQCFASTFTIDHWGLFDIFVWCSKHSWFFTNITIGLIVQ